MSCAETDVSPLARQDVRAVGRLCIHSRTAVEAETSGEPQRMFSPTDHERARREG